MTAFSTVFQERIAVPSHDGVTLSVSKNGSGPALLLVHGTGATSMSWFRVVPALAEHFTVYALDRRGRAPSGDRGNYSVSIERDDLIAVVDAIGRPVTLVAHSYGAVIAISALGRLRAVERLVLYEPPVVVTPRPDHAEMNRAMQRAWEAGDREQVVTTFVGKALGPEQLATFRSSPVWPHMVGLAGTIVREAKEVQSFRLVPAELAGWMVPTTMLAGALSPDYLRKGAVFVAETLGNCRLEVLEGQGHLAAQAAPELFVAKILEAARAGAQHR